MPLELVRSNTWATPGGHLAELAGREGEKSAQLGGSRQEPEGSLTGGPYLIRMSKPASIDLSALSLEELAAVKDQLEKDLERFAQFMETLGRAANRFGASANALQALREEEQGKPMLVPLTMSMYVRGKLDTTESVLVDIGTGYFAEKTVDQAVDFCKRKVAMLREKVESTQQLMRDKQAAFLQVRSVFQQKVAAQAAKAGQPAVAATSK